VETGIAGIDYSTFYADVVIVPLHGEAKDAKWYRAPLRDNKVADDMQAFDAARNGSRRFFCSAIPWRDVRSAFIEAPIPGGKSNMTIVKLSRIQGSLLRSIPQHVRVEECHPTEWKGILTGNKVASKEQIRTSALELGFSPVVNGEEEVQDAFDAFGMCWALKNLTIGAMSKLEMRF
jgi:hypothetical protein